MTLFAKATKHQSKLRMALIGPSGSGKTYTALRVAAAAGGKIALIDTERGSASKYADMFEFDVLNLDSFHPERFMEAINAAGEAGYDWLVIDSLSHAWMGKDGALELVDNAKKRSQSGNSFTAWRDVTPIHNHLVDAILGCKCHVIATMRAKTEYVVEKDEKGRSTPRKIGMAPVQRDGMEYEFDVIADMNHDNDFVVSKSRCPALNGQIINKPGEDLAATLMNWCCSGEKAVEPLVKPVAAEPLTTKSQNIKAHELGAQKFGKGKEGRTRYGAFRDKFFGRVCHTTEVTELECSGFIDALADLPDYVE
jgi:hypothetical protein